MSFSPPPRPLLPRSKNLLSDFLNDDRGMIVSAELMIIMTVGIIALVVGISTVTSALNSEYTDIANALTGLNQSYNVSGHFVGRGRGGYCTTGNAGNYHAYNRGMGFNDTREVFSTGGGTALVAGSYASSGGGHFEMSAVGVGHAVTESAPAMALVEESALLVEELVEVEEVDAIEVVETEVDLEERLRLLEAEAARLEAAQVKSRATIDCPNGCPLDELQELENRIRRLRMCMEQQNVFDCGQK